MGKTRALLIAAALVSAMSTGAITTGAYAADLLLPPPPLEPPPPAEFGGWYLRGDVGVGVNQISELRSTFSPTVLVPAPQFDQYSIGDSAFAGAGVGYQINNWFRVDVTGEYRTAANYRATQSYANIFGLACGVRCYDIYSAQHSAAVFLANGYVDLGTWYGITPFVGGGVGVAVNWLNNLYDLSAQPAGGFGIAQDATKTNFAWAVMAGLAYNVTPNFKVELGYRYLDMGKFQTNVIGCQGAGCAGERQSFQLASHDIRLGFRYALLAPAPMLMAPPGPLVRKY